MNNAPVYKGETNLSDIDAIIAYCREAQAAQAEADETLLELKKTEKNILLIMQHFDIPRGTVLTGVMADQLTYEVWAAENDTVYIMKTQSLQPKPDNPNIITVRFSNWVEEEDLEDL